MADPFIECDGLVKIYKVAELEHVALQGLSLTINQGELVGIVGASGSGKTTVMSILGGLDRPTAGKVMVNGQDLLRMPDRQLNRYRREQVGFVWQQSARNLVPYLNAIQNVMLPMTLAGASGKNNRAYAEELLGIVGLGDRTKHGLPELSGGEQQRVAIAVALANNPILLLADEPTGEVDSSTAQAIYGTFQMLARELGVTTVLVSHDPGIARHVDRVVMIRDGMLASETRRQVRARPVDGETEHGEATANGTAQEAEDEEFEEVVVVDRAGRIHIPQDYIEELNFGKHATIEVSDDGSIVIKPVIDEAAAQTEDTNAAEAEDDDSGALGSIKGLLGRFGRGGKKAKSETKIEAEAEADSKAEGETPVEEK